MLTSLAEAQLKSPINLASAQQVSEALHVTLSLPKPAQQEAASKATHGSTGEAHLQDLVLRYPDCAFPALVLEHRELSKLMSTFLEPLAARAIRRRSEGHDGGGESGGAPSAALGLARCHSMFFCFSTGTGRLSSRHPNVQQIPKRPTLLSASASAASAASTASVAPGGLSAPAASINVRDAFVAPDGYLLLSADYSQLEMRLMSFMR